MQRKALDPRILAMTAVMTAIVFVLTQVNQIPTPDEGYVHLGDAGIFFSAFAFGPWIGAIAGGLGTALADHQRLCPVGDFFLSHPWGPGSGGWLDQLDGPGPGG